MGISNPKLKSMGMAFGVSAIAAIGTMFLPVALLEGVTGATGLSELVPATAAPLGDTARALIAFGTGAFTLAVMAIVLVRKDRDASAVPTAPAAATPVDSDTTSNAAVLLDGLKERLMNFKMPQMPWAKKSDSDILDLADLPKLRTMDVHPDAPARRPFSASSDLGVDSAPAAQMTIPAKTQATAADLRFWPERLDEEDQAIGGDEPAQAAPAADLVDEWALPPQEVSAPVVAPVFVPEAAVAPAVSVQPTVVAQTHGDVAVSEQAAPSLEELVNQLENAVKLRQQQLSALEMVAAQIKSETVAVAPQSVASHVEVEAAPVIEQAVPVSEPIVTAEPAAPMRTERPTLEAVPTSQRKMADEDMDAALNAALETLQRMNAQGR